MATTKKKKKAAPKKRATAQSGRMVALKANIPLVLNAKIGAVIKDDLLAAANKKIHGFADRYSVTVEGSPGQDVTTLFDTKKDAMTFAKSLLKIRGGLFVGTRQMYISAVRVSLKNIIDGRNKEIAYLKKDY